MNYTQEEEMPAFATHTTSRARQVPLISVPRVPELEDGRTRSTGTSTSTDEMPEAERHMAQRSINHCWQSQHDSWGVGVS